MPKLSLGQMWNEHIERWKNCHRCSLAKSRHNVVLLRGAIPCDVLFVGEAPGGQEDTIGQPFVGRAGSHLDEIIERSIAKSYCSECYLPTRETGVCRDGHKVPQTKVRVAFTNAVACRPPEDNDGRQLPPTKSELKTCSPRLTEIAGICKPRLVILVGREAKAAIRSHDQLDADRWIPKDKFLRFEDIDHPAYILRAVPAQKTLLTKKAVIRISTAVQGMLRDAEAIVRKNPVAEEPYEAPDKRYFGFDEKDIPF